MQRQKGSAPLLIIIIVVAAVLIGGYVMMQKSGKAPSVPGLGGLGLNPNCKYNDPDLCKFINKAMAGDFMKNGLSGTSTTTDKSGKKMVSKFESQGEDKTHIMSIDNGKETFNWIRIADANYYKDYSDNKWWKQVTPKEKGTPTGTPEEKAAVPNVKDLVKKAEDKTTYKKIGKEACGTYTCFKYQVINPDMGDTTEYIFFDDQTYTMRKTQSISKDGTVSDFEFDYSPVSITEPSPIKSGPAGTTNPFMPGGSAGGAAPSKEELQNLMQQYQNNPPGQ